MRVKKGQLFCFQVMFKRSDIGVGLNFKRRVRSMTSPTEGRTGPSSPNPHAWKSSVVIPMKKIDSDDSPYLFSAVSKHSGVFVIHFDNSDSPMLGKSILNV